MKVATHLVFAECCWFATSAVFDVHYDVPEVFAVACIFAPARRRLPKSWLGRQLGSVSEELNRSFGHRSFLHSLLALLLVTTVLGLPLWWITGNSATLVAVFVGYGSHLFADMMTLGGVQLFWPSELSPSSPAATSTASSPARARRRYSSSWCSSSPSSSTPSAGDGLRRPDLPHGRSGSGLRQGQRRSPTATPSR